MMIISDDYKTTVNFLENNFSRAPKSYNITPQIKIIASNLFKAENYKLYESNISNYWENLILTKHAYESQFDIINKLISENIELPDKLICIAEKGDGFHGFRNRPWSAEEGNIHLTAYFKPERTFRNFHTGLLIVAAVSVIQTIDSIPDLNGRSKTKWVNDIILDSSKVCGIITQSFSTGNNISGAVIGIGLNVLTKPKFKEDIFTQAADAINNYTNADECNLPFVLDKLLSHLSENIELLKKDDYGSLLKIYRERSGVIGKQVEIYSDPINGKIESLVTGKVLNINENLEIILEKNPLPVKNGRLAIID